jgi:hypothetical protein
MTEMKYCQNRDNVRKTEVVPPTTTLMSSQLATLSSSQGVSTASPFCGALGRTFSFSFTRNV